MPDEPRFGDIQIGIDPAVPDGAIAFATRNPDGTTHVQLARIDADGQVHIDPPAGNLLLGPVIPDGVDPNTVDLAQFDVGRFTDMGWADADGLTYPDGEQPGPEFATGGLVTTAHGGRVLSTSGPISDAAAAAYLGVDWIDIERLRADAQRVNEEVERRARSGWYRNPRPSGAAPEGTGQPEPEAPPAPAGDVLDRIDAAVDELCACGCRVRVPTDGPSAYFATPGCQRRWHGQRATNPQEVYQRPDAATVYVGADHVDVPLNEHRDPPAGSVLTDPAGEPQPGRRRRRDYPHADHVHISMRDPDVPPPCSDVDGMAYRLTCIRCDRRVIPQPAGEQYDITHFGQVEPVRTLTSPLHLECPNCGAQIPTASGRAYIADVTRHGLTRYLLTLFDGQARVQRIVTTRELDAAGPMRDRLLRCYWLSMERELDRFHRNWVGRVRADEQVAMPVIGPNTNTCITGM